MLRHIDIMIAAVLTAIIFIKMVKVMQMFKVRIYIETSLKGFRKQTGWYGAVIEFIKKNGEPETRDIFEKVEATANQIMIIALTQSLTQLTKECEVTVYIASEYVRSSIEKDRIRQWKMNGWNTARNEPVANVEEWQQLEPLLQKHKVIFSYKKTNGYKEWLLNEIQKRKDDCEKWEQQRLLQ